MYIRKFDPNYQFKFQDFDSSFYNMDSGVTYVEDNHNSGASPHHHPLGLADSSHFDSQGYPIMPFNGEFTPYFPNESNFIYYCQDQPQDPSQPLVNDAHFDPNDSIHKSKVSPIQQNEPFLTN